MSLSRPRGAFPTAVAIALVASLAGLPHLIAAEDEHGHRCTCPAGAHACACPRCAAAHAARDAREGAPRSCCHGGGAVSAARGGAERPRPPPDAACASATCGGRPVAATLAAGAEPFVAPQHPLSPPPGRDEGFALAPHLAGGHPAAPEPPPPRA